MISMICVVCALAAIVIVAAGLYFGALSLARKELENQLLFLSEKGWGFIVFAVVLAVVVAMLLAYVLARNLSARITRIAEHVERLTEGDYSSRINISSKGEIGQLAAATNKLGKRLSVLKDAASQEKSKNDILLDRMSSGVIVTDEAGILVLMNPAASETLGISKDAIAGALSYDDIMLGFNGAPQYAKVVSLCYGGGGAFRVTKDNNTYIVRCSMLKGGEGEPFNCLMMIDDQSEAAKLEAMQSDFVANVSHELKTPITIIKSYTETLLDGKVSDQEDKKAMLERISFEAERMGGIVRDLLTLARLENNKEALVHKRMKLKPLVDTTVDMLKDRADERGIELKEVFRADPQIVIVADKTRLQQAMLNILLNSLNYTNPGGSVTIYVGEGEDKVWIRISDTGIGIKKEDLNRVFERFFRVDKARSRAAGGTGLGLPIAKEYIEAHGGTIEASSTLGKGTSMLITLPIGNESGAGDE